jgi:hypothetical protein
MENKKNKLWDVDIQMFNSMEGNYVSIEEENFFRNLRFKQESEITLVNDLLMSEHDNPEKIYIVREIYDEYVVGVDNLEELEIHVMNLHEALAIKLEDIGISGTSLTLFEWLRGRNYQGIKYNRNYDYM